MENAAAKTAAMNCHGENVVAKIISAADRE
jgi:hypothetical protein